jgi:hypothetical protein
MSNLSVSSILLIIGLVLLLVGIVILGPIVVIWSINTLFSLHIPYTLQTWAASAILSSVVSGGLVSRSK